MRKVLLVALAVLVAATLALPASAGPSGQAGTGAAAQPSGQLQSANGEYVVAYADGASAAAAHAAIKAAGGTVVKENAQVGVATVKSQQPRFIAAAGRQSGLVGAARNRPIGKLPSGAAPKDDVERLTAAERTAAKRPASTNGHAPGQEPLADLQWDMQMIHATPTARTQRARAAAACSSASSTPASTAPTPTSRPNFDRTLSRNFTTDIPLIDGPCEDEPDGRATTRPTSTRTATAPTSPAPSPPPINGLGIAGVAPKVTLVNIRAGQDSGFFFLQPTVDALTYAGDIGIDVVNMSFFIDPWLYNCPDEPGRLARGAGRAADDHRRRPSGRSTTPPPRRHARRRARQRGHRPRAPDVRRHQPGLPARARRARDGRQHLPRPCRPRADGVIASAPLGPSRRKADYSNYGIEQTDVVGAGWLSSATFAGRRRPATREPRSSPPTRRPWPSATASSTRTGRRTTPFVVRDCSGRHVRVLPVPAGHLDGVAARRRRGRADRQPATASTTASTAG